MKIHGRKGIYGRSKRRVRKLEAGEMDEDDFFGMGKHYHISMFEINLERAHDIGQEGEDLDSGERGECPRRTLRGKVRGDEKKGRKVRHCDLWADELPDEGGLTISSRNSTLEVQFAGEGGLGFSVSGEAAKA